jgi:hypothetical protein
MALDHLVDLDDLMAGQNKEAIEVRPHFLVLGDTQLERGAAAEVAALADEDGGAGAIAPLDRLVDAASLYLRLRDPPFPACGGCPQAWLGTVGAAMRSADSAGSVRGDESPARKPRLAKTRRRTGAAAGLGLSVSRKDSERLTR